MAQLLQSVMVYHNVPIIMKSFYAIKIIQTISAPECESGDKSVDVSVLDKLDTTRLFICTGLQYKLVNLVEQNHQ